MNPGGQPKGLRAKIDSIGDVDRVVAFLFDVVYGKLSATSRVQDRVAAAREILDRRFGKPVVIVETPATAPERTPMSALDTDKLKAMRDKLAAELDGGAPDDEEDDDGDDGEGVAAIDVDSTEKT